MATRTWNGGSDQLFHKAAWNPAGAPAPGDTLYIGTGTASASWTVLSGLQIYLNGQYLGLTVPPPAPAPAPVLRLGQTIIAADTTISLGGTFGTGPNTATIDAEGFNLNFGTITNTAMKSAGPPDGPPTTLTIDVGGRSGGTLVNEGTISVTANIFAPSTMIIHGDSRGSTLLNDALISSRGIIKLDIDVIGKGNIAFGAVFSRTHDGPLGGPTLEFERAVSQGQTVDFKASVAGPIGTDSHGALILDDPAKFHGLIADFTNTGGGFGDVHPDEIVLSGEDITSFSYRGNAAGGELTLREGCRTVAHLRFAGAYTTDDFQITHLTTGSVIETKPIV